MDKLTAITELTACKFVAKSLSLPPRIRLAGVERAMPATMPLLETLAAIERIEREATKEAEVVAA